MPKTTHSIDASLWGSEAIKYDASEGVITYPQNMSGQRTSIFSKIENVSTKTILYSRGVPGLGGTFNKNAKGEWELTLAYDGDLKGGDGSIIKTTLDAPSSMLSGSQLKAQESNLQKEQALALAEVSTNTGISVGQYGFEIISDTVAHIGPFCAVLSMQNGTYMSASTTTMYGASNLSTFEMVSGLMIPGAFTSITLNSGTLLAYYATPQPSNVV